MSLNFDEFNSVVKIFDKQSSMLQDQPYLWRKIDDKYSSLSWKEVRNNVEIFSTALKNLGILAGDRVVIVSENRPEWQIADLSIMAIGAISVPAYTTSTTNDYEYIIKHSGARCIIVSNHDLANKVFPAVLNSHMCQTVIKINDDNKNYDVPITVLSWNSLINENNNSVLQLAESIKNHKRTDTACIIYTSGTGGNPKGVMLSHGAMLANCTGCKYLLEDIVSSLKEIRFLSWLPLSHSYEHTITFYMIGIGAQIYYAEGIEKLLVNMAEARPHFMTAVPRFYDSLHTRISQGLKKQSKISQFFFKETLRLGKKTYFNEPLSFFEKNPLDTAELKGHSRIIFFTRNRDLQIQMSMETLTEGFKKFMLVLDTLEDDTVKIQMIDLSFKDQVVVRDRISTHSASMKTPTN